MEVDLKVFEVEVKKEVGNKVVAKHSILFVEVNLGLWVVGDWIQSVCLIPG